MAEPSYYPLGPLKYSAEGTTSHSLEQNLKGHSDPHYLADATKGAGHLRTRSTMFLPPLHSQRSRRGSLVGNQPFWRVIETPLAMALLPLFAIAYLAFCYTVHHKIVPVNTYGLYNVTPQHLTTIKGGITSISIIVISVALYPVYDTISKLKSEEFFRSLTSHSDGIALETINHVSTPSFGYLNMMIAMLRRRCSNYYVLGIFTSLLVSVVATLAPGVLTVASVLADGELMAFAIGAVSPQSVLNGTMYTSPTFNAGLVSDTAASIAWAEMELGVQYSFGAAHVSDPNYAAFIAPVPFDLSATTSARWLSDVIGINPKCSWASTNLSSPVRISANSSSFNRYFATAYLTDFDLDVRVTSDDISSSNKVIVTVKDPSRSTALVNHTTQAIPSDGSTIFLLSNCQSGCSPGVGLDLSLDLTGINTAFTIALTDQTWTMAVLACMPNVVIETREVRNNGRGLYSVQSRPSGGQLTRQGNLNPLQTTALFSIATMQLTQSGGKLTGNLGQYSPLGSEAQADILFGLAQLKGLPASQKVFSASATVHPAPIVDITQGYSRIIQSAAKSYLSGYLGTAYVPGRISRPQLVFAASIPNLAVSTAVFALLAILLVFSNFRSGKGVEFTLSNVAAAVYESELPARFAQMKGEETTGGYGRMDEEADGEAASDGADSAVGKSKGSRTEGDASDDHQGLVQQPLGEKRIYMQRRKDGSPILHIS